MKRSTLDPLCLFGMIMLAQILISPAQSSEIYSYVDTDGVRHYTDIHPSHRPNTKPAQSSEIYSYVDTNGVRHYTDIHPSHRPTVKLYPQPTSQSTGSVKIYRLVDAQGVIHLADNLKDSRYRLIYQGG